eukprot:scaffold306491_cov22-Tisochrysis_lutea.AAC.1
MMLNISMSGKGKPCYKLGAGPVSSNKKAAQLSIFAGAKCMPHMHNNCPVCFEYIFDSVNPICVLPCGHTIHQ